MSELEKTTYDRGFYNGIREARQIFAKHLNVSTSTDEVKWDNVSKTEILSEIDNFMIKNESHIQPQLTIPKSIADELDRYDFELTSKGLMYRNMDGTLSEFLSETNYGLPQLITQTITGNYRIVFAYLNPLTRDLVKVGEGE